MATSAELIRNWQGPAVLSYGYRPFFLGGALCAALSMPVWLMLYAGQDILPLATDPISWHAHSLLFSYLWAVAAGFLTTAVPNWTGRFPIIGWPLLGLFSLWLLSIVATTFSALLPLWLVFVCDLLFPFVFIAAIGREIVAGKNWRNLKVLAHVALLVMANVIFDIEAYYGDGGYDGYGARLALAVGVMLIALIGGRVVPSFTRNFLNKIGIKRLPAQHDRYDQLTMIISGAVLLLFVLFPDGMWLGWLCLLAGLLQFVRLWRWRGFQTLQEPLVWVLHLGYLFIPLGFIALWLANDGLFDAGRAYAQHVLMAGAIGLMTLAIMSRASLGHAGRPLTVGWPVAALYLMVVAAVILRVTAGVYDNALFLLHLSGTLWSLAFLGFVVLYWNVLTKPRETRVKA